ncbi:phytochrome-like protein cph2 [mine drainage metagenome]|uniref:Phytochrome-like protein cph2 n=1 Tax=mine drainage metagenome TaxID=410659 RepID=A0A1J5PXJ8_9ZZZZ
MKILLLDDEPYVLRLLTHQLAKLGFSEVIPHERAQDALALLEKNMGAIGLVFCDLQMPEMDGVEFVRHLARIGYAGGLVMVSGEDDRILKTAEKLALAHRLNVLGALHKPVSPEQLWQVLENRPARAATPSDAKRQVYEPGDLKRAITNAELVNYYQPKVEMVSGKVAGVETLVRWRHPRDGLVFPDQFIPIAEEHGLIDDLTRIVLSSALRQARVWQDRNLHLHVAVNVSMDNLGNLDFPDLLAREAQKEGIALSSLLLEVTESRLMKNPTAPLDILTRLRLKHIGLSIDDFGTGHSSLAQLRDIPFNELKVDRGFVHGACRDTSLRTIFEASVGMARQLGMQTVAEGVEDQDDWDFLRAAGCDLAQGYFIAKPMPADDLEPWLTDWETRRCKLLG